jgi:hypothetical protein
VFIINIDVSDLTDLLDLKEVAEEEIQKAAADLTIATKGKIMELANEKLHSRRGMFLEGLTNFKLDNNTWVINLDAKVRWIDDGMDEHSMLDDLLKSKKAKRAKDGSTYVVVPFQHNKGKQNMTPAQQSLLNTIKKEMAKVGASPDKIENYANGSPKLGLVRSLDITQAPVSTAALRIGRGPRGSVAQGPTGIPLLKGVRVYQAPIPDYSPAGQTKVGRYVMTFRVASSKHRNQGGRWHHPGTEATNLMEEGLKWAMETWESKIAPSVLAKIMAGIS